MGLGLAGCRGGSRVAAPVLQGERRDPDFHHGHLLRDGKAFPEPSRVEKVAGVILGGGIAGLSAGWRWSHAGLSDYRLLELESQPGGNSRCTAYEPVSAPIAAHYLPVPNREARAVRRVLREMGTLRSEGGKEVLAEEELCQSREERIYYKGFWYDGLVPREALGKESVRQLEAFTHHIEKLRATRDKQGRKVFALPLHYSSREEQYLALDRISIGQYLKEHGWDDPYLLWLVNYACRDDFGGTLNDCSAWAGLHYFASRDGGGLAEPGDLLVWPEGNNHLAKHLLSKQQGQVTNKAMVIAVKPHPRGVTVDYLEIDSGQVVRLEAQAGVWSLPAFLRSRLLDPDFSSEPFVYQPWVTANIVLDRMPKDQEAPGMIAWDNVIHDSPSLGYVVATHQLLQTDPNRPTIWTWYRPFVDSPAADARKELLESSWESWKNQVITDLHPLHPDIEERCRRLDVTVLGHGMIRPSVGFVWGKEIAEAREPLGRLSFGHSDLSGISLFEEAQFRGVMAAEEALTALGIEHESFL